MMDNKYEEFKDKAIKALNDNWCKPILGEDDVVEIFKSSNTLADLKEKLLHSKICYCPCMLEDISNVFGEYNSDQCCYMYENGQHEDDEDYSICGSNGCWIEALDRYFN